VEALLKDGDEKTLARSDLAQPLVTLANLSAAACLEERGFCAAATAGHSLGEYAALVQAAIISAEDCFTLVVERGRIMQAVSDELAQGDGAPGMAAVIGLDPETVDALLSRWDLQDLYAANYNSKRQLVVSGSAAALAEAEKRFKEAGARRVLPLKVAGPFHSPLMAKAAREFAPALEKVSFNDPRIPFFSNVTGRAAGSGAEAKELALKQITSPVRWTLEEEALAASELTALVEAGPGRTLQGLWKDSGSPLPCYGAGTIEEIDRLGAELSPQAQEA
ncbi:MAG: ACP S-malonyltransferase, partial [Spirochaetaceae bacterium]|nr:ACP S-malonyltransferase [Spirochaetaceae bacterium]